MRWKCLPLVVVAGLAASCTGCICDAVGQPLCTVEALFVSPSVDRVVELRLISILDAATRTVNLALYSFTDDQLGAALIRAYQRGVAVRVILDQGQPTAQGGEYPALVAAGIEVVVEEGTGLMHHKFLVVDGTVTVTGSYNWSDAADQSNFENVAVIVCSEVAAAFTAEFNRLWSALTAGLRP